MNTFKLKIMSPDGIFYDAPAYSLSIRAIDGEVSVYAGHIPFLTAVGMGEARIYTEQGKEPRRAACCGGMLTVSGKEALLAPTTFEWAEDIDVSRARAAKEKAQKRLDGDFGETEKKLAKLKLMRADLRIKVAERDKK